MSDVLNMRTALYKKISLFFLAGIIILAPLSAFAAPAVQPTAPSNQTSWWCRTFPSGVGCPGHKDWEKKVFGDTPTTGEKPTPSVTRTVVEGVANWLFGITIGLIAWIGVFITEILVMILFGILAIIGSVFDFVVVNMVIGMSKFVNSTSAVGIRVGWTIVRDLANVGIIGGLIATAIGTIIQSSTYNAEKFLAKLLIAALLVNFSYFIAGAIIDASNFIASTTYLNLIVKNDPVCASISDLGTWVKDYYSESSAYRGCSIAGQVFKMTNIQMFQGEWMPTPEPGAKPTLGQDFADSFSSHSIQLLVTNIMLMIFILVMMYVFLNAIALLTSRFVSLTLLLVTSPFGIAGSAIPYVSSYADKWWKALISQAFFVPIYFVLVGLSLKILAGIVPTLSNFENRSISGSVTNSIGIIVTFMVVIGFMLIALRVAKQLAEQTPELKDIYKYVGGATNYPIAVAGRETLGRFGDYAGIRYKQLAAEWRLDQSKFPFVKGLDRSIQKGLKDLKEQKFMGYDSFHSEKEAGKARVIEQENERKVGSVRKKLFGHEMGNLKGENGLMGQLKSAQKTIDRDFTYDMRGKYRDKDGTIHQLYVDKDGNTTRKEFSIDANGNQVRNKELEENMGQLRERLEGKKAEKDEEDIGGTGYKSLRQQAQSEITALPPGTIDEWYDEDPQLLVDAASAMTSEQYMEAVKSAKVSRKTKRDMREARHGHYKKMVMDLQADVDSGRVREGGKEYSDRMDDIFNHAKKVIRSKDEFVELITSDYGKEMRNTRVLWHGSTNGMYVKAQESTDIGYTENRANRALKRKAWLDNQARASITMIAQGDDAQLTDAPSDGWYPKKQAKKWAEKQIEVSRKIIKNDKSTEEDKRAAREDLRLASIVAPEKLESSDQQIISDMRSTESDEAFVARKRKEATDGMAGWYQGKEDKEVASEMQDRSLFHPVTQAGMSTAQLMALEQDQRFLDAVQDSILAERDIDDPQVRDLMYNDNVKQKYSWPSKERVEKINARRIKRLGIDKQGGYSPRGYKLDANGKETNELHPKLIPFAPKPLGIED